MKGLTYILVFSLLLFSSCNVFKNIVKDKEHTRIKDNTETKYEDKSFVETTTEVDTNIRIAPIKTSLLTSINSLLKNPIQVAEINGLGIRLHYDSSTGSLGAEAFQKERLIPVKQKSIKREYNDKTVTEQRDIKYSNKDKHVEQESAVDWDKVIIWAVVIVCVFWTLYKIINRKK